MKKASFFIMIFSVISKILGFLRETILGSVVGAGNISDAFIASFSLPATFFSVIVAAFSIGLIPMYTRVENEEGIERANHFLSNTLNIMCLLAAIISSIIFLFTEQIASILVINPNPELLVYLIAFLKITAFSIIFTSIIQILTGFLHVKRSFLAVALIALPVNVIIIIFIYLTQIFSVDILPYGIILSYVVQATLTVLYAKSKGFVYKFTFNFKDKYARRMVYLAIPLMIGSATNSVGNIVANALASSTYKGITLVNYALKVGNLVEGIFGLAIVTVMYPTLSKAISMGNYDKARKEFSNSIISELVLILPSMVGLLLLTQPIIELLFVRRKFTALDGQLLTPVLFAYALGLVFYSIHNMIVRVFYSFQDMKTPVITSVSIILVKIILAFVLNNLIGLYGITLAYSIAFFLGTFVEAYLIQRKFDTFIFESQMKEIVKIIISNVIMGIVIVLCIIFLQDRFSNTIFLFSTIIVAIITYGISIFALKVETVTSLISSITHK